jgi:hypothetical protein
MNLPEEKLNAWVDRALGTSGLPCFYDYAKMRVIAKEAAKLAYEAGANDEFLECCAALGRFLSDETKAEVIRMLKDVRRPSLNRYEASLATYKALYGRPEIASEVIRDTGLY